MGSHTVRSFLILAVIAGALTALLAPASAQDVAAVVNGESISATALTDALYARTGKLVLNQLIDEVLIRQAAKKAGVTVPKEEVDAKLVGLRERVESAQSQTGLDWLKWLTSQEVSEAVLRDVFETEIMIDKIVEPTVKVTDEEIQAFYNANQAQFLQPTQAHVAIIAVDTETQANDILKQLQGGGDFAALAKQYSQDPTSKDLGGDIGPITQGPVFEAAMKMEPGQVGGPYADPVDVGGQTKTYYFVAKLISKQTEYTPPLDEVKEGIREYIFSVRMRAATAEWYRKLKADATIEVNATFGTPPGG